MYTIWNVLKDLITGKIVFPDATVVDERRNVCRSCDVRDKERNVCTACGCWLPTKTILAKSECPLEKWNS